MKDYGTSTASWREKLAARCQGKAEALIPHLRDEAMLRGYALTEHGSKRRDIDLVACPWTTAAVSPQELLAALSACILHRNGLALVMDGPEMKPHGRLAWSIHLGGGPYIDLSVMPRQI